MPFVENRKVILFLGCLCIFFPGSFLFGFSGVMTAEWQAVFQVGKAEVSRLMFFILAGTGCSMYLAGKLQEKISTSFLVLFGTLACSMGMIGAAYIQSIVQLYLWAFVEGFFCGFVYLPCLAFFQRLFPDQKGWITGILNLTFGGAAAVMSPIYTWLLVTKGYTSAAWGAALLSMALGTWCALFIRMPEKSPPAEDQSATPLRLSAIVRIPAFWFLWWAWALAGAAGVSLIVLAVPFGEHQGYGITHSVVILTSFNLLNGVGRLVCGKLSDTLSKTRMLQVIFLASGAAYFIMPWVSSLYGISLLAAIVGLAFGALFTVSAPLVTDVFGLENFGRIFGLVFTAYGFVAGFIGPWSSGVLLDMTGSSYKTVFSMFALFYLVTAALIAGVKKNNLQPLSAEDIRA